MPKYRTRFLVETPLQAEQDFQFSYRGYTLNFLFASGNNTAQGIEVETTCEAERWVAAARFVSSELIPPVQDAIGFHRKTSLLIGGCTQVLKAEPGQTRRKTILIDVRRHRNPPLFRKEWMVSVQQIIDCDPGIRRLSLRWLRTSYRPHLSVLDRFIYTWLALENLAGEKQVEKLCPHCDQPLPPYPAADRDAAFEILRNFDKDLTRKTFNDWWNRLRNSVFHGGKEPDAKFFGELTEVANRIQPAVERYLEQKLNVKGRNPAAMPVGPERQENVWWFLEFDSSSPEEDFPQRTPPLARVVELVESGQSTEKEIGCRTLSQREFENW